MASAATFINFLDYRATIKPSDPWRKWHGLSEQIVQGVLAVGGILMTSIHLPFAVMFLSALGEFNGLWPEDVMRTQWFWLLLVRAAVLSILLATFAPIMLAISSRSRSRTQCHVAWRGVSLFIRSYIQSQLDKRLSSVRCRWSADFTYDLARLKRVKHGLGATRFLDWIISRAGGAA